MTKQLPSLNKFWRMLRNHDWSFDYSDDSSVWRRGQAERNAIQEAMEAGGEEYKRLYEEYSKYAWRENDSIQQPPRPKRTKEEQLEDMDNIKNLSEKLEELKYEIWALEEEQITSSTQLWSLYSPIQSMISQISNLVEDKSKSPMWDTIAYKGYKRIKEDIDCYSK